LRSSFGSVTIVYIIFIFAGIRVVFFLALRIYGLYVIILLILFFIFIFVLNDFYFRLLLFNIVFIIVFLLFAICFLVILLINEAVLLANCSVIAVSVWIEIGGIQLLLELLGKSSKFFRSSTCRGKVNLRIIGDILQVNVPKSLTDGFRSHFEVHATLGHFSFLSILIFKVIRVRLSTRSFPSSYRSFLLILLR